MSRDFDVLVVGAGVIGAALACLLARRVCPPGRVALVADRLPTEPAAAADWDVRVFALARSSQRLLAHAGIWGRLPAARVSPYERMSVWAGPARGGEPLTFDCAEIGEPDLGSIVEGRALQWQSLQAARAAGVTIIEAGIEALSAAAGGTRVRLDDGRELGARLIAAADGTGSKTRSLLGIASAGHSYHQDALVAHVRTVRPHLNTARQRFLGTGPLAFLPLPDGRSSIVWSAARGEAQRLAALDAAAFGVELEAAFDGVLGACELTTPVASFPLQLQYALEYVRPHAVLLGDAAHAVHPLAGQGMNLGLMDCASLIEVLGGAAEPKCFGDMRLLRRYERWRRSENLLAATAFDALDRVFSRSGGAVASLSGLGMRAVDRLPPLKRALARRALGLSGDTAGFLREAPAGIL